jgi:chemotaxis protein MotB
MIIDDDDLITEKPKCKPCKSGSPLWMSTFADMATLLMAFFVLLVAFADMQMGGSQITASDEKGPGTQDIEPIIEYPDGDDFFNNKLFESAEQLGDGKVAGSRVGEPTMLIGASHEGIELLNGSRPSKTNSTVEALKKSLAKEIAKGKVVLLERPNQVIVQVSTYDSSGRGRSGPKLSSEISLEDMLIYSKISDVKSRTDDEQSFPILVEETGLSEFEKGRILREKAFAAQYNRIVQELREQRDKGTLSVVIDGDKIIIRLASSVSFESGSSTIRASALPLLEKIGKALKSVAGVVRVDGHTDNIPLAFNEVYRSNWDLSSARAAAVAGIFLARPDLKNVEFMVSGLSDIQPLENNSTPAGRAINRRIEIVILEG